jgi:iron complex transport system permease protein
MQVQVASEEYARFVGRKWLLIGVCSALVILLAGVAATLGTYELSLTEVFDIIFRGMLGEISSTEDLVVWDLRMPRILMAILGGFGLAIAGTLMQAILRNPLASPFTLGIASAASFGASLAIILGAGFVGGMYLIIGNAFIFTLLAAFAVYGLAYHKGITPETMIMAGIAIMYLFSALTSFLQYVGTSEDVHEVVFWMMGSLGRADWETAVIVGAILLLSFPYLFLKSVDLNVMGAGDESARSMGVNVGRTRVSCMVLASLITAGIICFTGTIGFIGLVAPHITRMIIGADHRFLLPASGIIGALLLLGADTASRTILAPQVLPVGIMTAFLGVPFFVYLFFRREQHW